MGEEDIYVGGHMEVRRCWGIGKLGVMDIDCIAERS
jgi:hypothetical protein